ncbi:hypothetical protein JIQ42_02872 [Leishmania sp. Namibia]|uniref:hypothetical protein n=1 Tax=Leishmania sp. Namibia TaxID=2802991 RepID=UPI001B586C4A|nr:hypothetical protein JIQ42_02872 [Leishmania sp. Namibia]
MRQLYSSASACIATVFLGLMVLPAVSTVATPLARNREPVSSNTSLSAYDYELAWKALHFSKSAYCPLENVKQWNCGDACSSASADFDFFGIYDDYSVGTFGFSGIDHVAKHIVVVFRGTSNAVNWLYNLDFWLTQYPNPRCQPNCKVHRGFYNAFNSLRLKLIQDLVAMHKLNPSYTFFITGHSLGGAMALLAALELAAGNSWDQAVADSDAQPHGAVPRLSRQLPVELYTFGEPRVGNQDFSKWTASVFAKHQRFRITHARDPVPRLPPRMFSYLHVPQEVWYPGSDGDAVMCQERNNQEDPSCSDSVYGTRVADHLLYLGVCTQCECTDAVMEEINRYELPPELYAILALDHAMKDLKYERR